MLKYHLEYLAVLQWLMNATEQNPLFFAAAV